MMETLRKAMMMRSKLKNINNSQESYVNWYTDNKEIPDLNSSVKQNSNTLLVWTFRVFFSIILILQDINHM